MPGEFSAPSPNIPRKPTKPFDVLFAVEHHPLQEILRVRPWAQEMLYNLSEFHHSTYVHSIFVGKAAYALGARMGLPETDRQALGLAGLLHDFGKTTVNTPGYDVRRVLDSNEVLLPTHPDRIRMRPHVENGFATIRAKARKDAIGQRAAEIMVGHHKFQTHHYPDDPTLSSLIGREIDPELKELQRYLAACDQAVGLAMGGKGGHAYSGNLTTEQVQYKLLHDRETDMPQDYFRHIIRHVMAVLTEDLELFS